MFHVEHGILLLLMIWGAAQPLQAQEIRLSPEETQVLQYTNELRANPRQFFRKYVLDYSKSDPRIDPSYIRSLKSDLSHLDSLPLFAPTRGLEQVARFMSRDLARSGGRRLSHVSSGGLTFEARMSRVQTSCAGENLYSGTNRTALQMVLDLLIDWRVPDLGHRKNLLNPNFDRIGISISPWGKDGAVLATDFSCPQ
ncbi:MAG TPA: CAP domain-containing protein [Chitinophagaceae bacterium]|nr:CAP domain-containing protein [Chitinophagaceae bacterium]